jgi:voltage-gated potassium channel
VIILLDRILRSTPRRHIAILLASVVALVFIYAALFARLDHYPFSTGLYWAITTATTVGYGDVTPNSGAGRVIASLTMLTTIPLLASVFALATGGVVASGVRRILAMREAHPGKPYRMIIGMSQTVPSMLEELRAVGVSVVLVADVEPATLPPEVHLVRGDPANVATLRKARLQDAEQALITGPSDGAVLVSAVLVRKLAPELTIAALVSSPSVREALHELGVQLTISADQLIAGTLAKSLEAPHAGEMLTNLVESNAHRLREVQADQATVGRQLSAVRDERSELVLGLVRNGKFTLGLSDDVVIMAGDYLLTAEATEPVGEHHG